MAVLSSTSKNSASSQQPGGYSNTDVLFKLSRRNLVICRIVLDKGGATGFLIGKDLVMTNHHVLPDQETARKARAIFFYTQGNAEFAQVDFDPDNFFHTSPTPDLLGFKPITKDHLDFTIISIKSHPKITEISHLAFSIFDSLPIQIDMHANIIHHPVEKDGTSYQKVSFRHNLVKEVTQFTLHYTTATMPGSSGSPVIDDEGNLMALHRATCSHLLSALLEERALTALLNHFFPGVTFSTGPLSFANSEGKSAKVDKAFLYIFTKGALKGRYYHEGKMASPVSLFELIKTRHNPAKAWAVGFLKDRGIPIPDYHCECNTAVTMHAIHAYLQRQNLLELIETGYTATQKTVVSILKESYLQHLAFLPLFLSNDPLPIESFFTQLSIVSSTSQDKKEKEARDPHLIENDSLREIYARLQHPETPLEMKNLFDQRDNTPIRRVLLLGRAGIGKSTLCQKIAYDWSLGNLFHERFEIIFHLKLRELNAWIQQPQNHLKGIDDPDIWLCRIIAFLCYQGAYTEKILQELRNKPDKVLIMLDGWDEASSALTQAFKLCLQRSCVHHFLLTSRPGVTHDIHGSFQLVVENMGFSPTQITTYAEKFFTHLKNPEVQPFLQHLREREDLLTIAHIPIQLQILCTLWHKGEKTFPKTLSAMLSKIVAYLFDWEEGKRTAKMPISKKRLLYQALGELAFKGLDQRQLILPRQLTEDVLSNQAYDTLHLADLIGTGLVKGCGEENDIYFIHLTYQEYCIAQSVSRWPSQQQQAFVQAYRYQPQFHLVIRMLASCLWAETRHNLEALGVFFEWLYSEPVDLIGSYQTELVLACLEECQSPQLEELVWGKYKIGDFVKQVVADKHLEDCLHRWMKLSKRVFLEVFKEVEKDKSLTERFLWAIQSSFRESYWSDELFTFIRCCLSDSDWNVLCSAVKILGKIVPHLGEKNIPILLDWVQTVLSNSDSYVRYSAVNALGEIAPHVGEKNILTLLGWVQTALSDSDWSVRRHSVATLSKITPHVGEKNIPTLLGWVQTALSNSDSDVRRHSVATLSKIAPHLGEKNIPTLLGLVQTALSDSDSYVRCSSVETIGKIAPHLGEKNIPTLLGWVQTALSDSDEYVRRHSVATLSKITPHVGEKNIPTLLGWAQTALSDSDSYVRYSAVETIRKIAPHILLDWFQTAFSNPDKYIRRSSVETVGNIAPYVGEKNIPTLLGLVQTVLSDSDSHVRRFAFEALGEISPYVGEKNICTLLGWVQTALSDSDSYVRCSSVETIGKIAPHVGEKNIPTLLGWVQTALSDSEWIVRRSSVTTIRIIAPHVGEKNIPTLLGWVQTALSNPKEKFSCYAVGILKEIAPQVKEKNIPTFLDCVQKLLSNSDEYVRNSAVKILGAIAPYIGEKNSPILLGWIQRALSDPRMEVSRSAVKILGAIAPQLGEKNILSLLDWIQSPLPDSSLWDLFLAPNTLTEIAPHLGKIHLSTFLDCTQKIKEYGRHPVQRLTLQSLLFILSSTTLAQHPVTKDRLIPHMINQAIPLWVTQIDKNVYQLHLGKQIYQEIDSKQRDLLCKLILTTKF
jgi:HEAT repeat protein